MESATEEKISLGQQTGIVTPQVPVAEEKKPKTQLFIIAGVVLVLVLTIATILIVLRYASSSQGVAEPVAMPASTAPTLVKEESPAVDAQVDKLNSQGTSTETVDMQKDLEDTSLDNLDKELEGLETLIQ
ncbi:hypothetical protein AUJ94_02300 [bacterium CG2_30_40_12]|uniref:Uncharacterized protein n=1 Tax=candidate division WWE3 bacterium CG23_combo_of_CG06-09_8_20_14_all_40_14 TaxID=1975095 RepID=A0A2G9XD39_UNCKA|nr:MAG: hypothetical protein AUJ94_02300 [bacterium CG2_30_40_12]PIP04874.1 MAG: hypothetical protein COX53_00010 [candidate division WWE3 bacterium CG23_combo_of_CG06-09_8_20_14_all_40_14]